MRTDSAINGICFISGITSARAWAAPVVVRMILFMTLLFFLRSFAPDFGNRSSTSWEPVTACTVAMEADSIFLGPKKFISGLII